MTVNRHNLAATGAPKTIDFATTIKDFLFNNYDETITGVLKTEITFATDFSDLSNSRYMIIVYYINKDHEPEVCGNARKLVSEFYRVYVIANGIEEKDNHTKLEEHVYDLIDGNPEGCISSGIQDLTTTGFQPVRSFQQDQNVLILNADDNTMKASYARVTALYEKTL